MIVDIVINFSLYLLTFPSFYIVFYFSHKKKTEIVDGRKKGNWAGDLHCYVNIDHKSITGSICCIQLSKLYFITAVNQVDEGVIKQ